MEQIQWYYMLDSERFGPVPQEQMEQWFASGHLSFDVLVWSQQTADWTPAANVPGFARLRQVAAVAGGARSGPTQSRQMSAEQSRPAQDDSPAEQNRPPQENRPAEQSRPVEANRPQEQGQLAEHSQSAEQNRPVEHSEPADSRAEPNRSAAANSETDELRSLIRQRTSSQNNAALAKNERFFSSYLRNAYRVLGITGATSQQELKQTAAGIRRQSKIGKTYSSPMDLAWIGVPPSRGEKDLLDAETRLLNPETRIKERLLWFHCVPEQIPADITPQDAAALALRWAQLADPVARHDAAVLMQFAAMADSPEFERQELWKQSTALWNAVLQDEEYWSLLCDLDDKLGFEPVCLAGDVFAQKDRFMELVTEPIVLMSKDALNNGNQQLFARVATLINPGSEQGEQHSSTAGSNSEIADEFHRMINALCEEIAGIIENDVDRNEKTYKANREKTLQACGRCETIFEFEIEKLLNNAKTALPQSSPELAELREMAACILEIIGGGYTWADDYTNGVRLLEKAEVLAADTAAEPKIKETLDNFRKNLEMQKMFGEQKRVNSAPWLYTMNTIGFMLYPALNEKPEPYLGSKRGIYYFVAMFIPIFPLGSYRAIFHADGTYSFISSIPLDKWGRIHQAVIVLPIVALMLFAALYKPSPEALARRAAEAAAETERNTNAVVQRVKAHVALPEGKYALKDLVADDDRALEDLAGRLKRTKPVLEQKQNELKAMDAKLTQLEGQKKVDKKQVQALKDELRKKGRDFEALVASYNSTIDIGREIIKERDAAADTFNARYARR